MYDARFWTMFRECDGRLAAPDSPSRRNMLDNVVRERCSADGRDGPASLDEGLLEGCNKRESLFVLFERRGSRRLVGASARLPVSSALEGCESWPRSRLPSDDCLRRCVVVVPLAAGAGRWSPPPRGCEVA